MVDGEETGSRWQFSLRTLLLIMSCIGGSICILSGLDNVLLILAVTLIWAPFLAAAIGFEWFGYSDVAVIIGVVTGTPWLMAVLWIGI